MKIFLIGWFGAGNLGDEAILLSEIRIFKSLIPTCQFHILSFNPSRTSRLIADIPEVTKIVRIGSKQNVVKSDFLGLLKSFREVDLVLIGGGGIFQDIYNYYPIPFFTTMLLLGKLFRKKLVMYCLGIGPVHSRLGKLMCRLAANTADCVSVRDSESRELLKEIGVKSHIDLSADPVFLLDPIQSSRVDVVQKRHKFTENCPVIGVCIQDLLDWSDEKRQDLAHVLDALSREKNARIIFIPFGSYSDKWFQDEVGDTVDVIASKRIADLMLEKCSIITEELSPREMLHLIDKMDFVISMRLHGIIMGLTAGVPVVALSYGEEVKLNSLMKRVGLENLFFDVRTFNRNELLQSIGGVLLDHGEVRAKIQSHVFDLQSKVNDNNVNIMNLL